MPEEPEISEISCESYNESYNNGGPMNAYHKHYTQSFYYPAWMNALKYIIFMDKNVKILEIGCGAGQFANLLFDNGFTNYKGFDYAEDGVKLSQKNNPKYTDCFWKADAFDEPEVENEQDIIICFEVLEHIKKDIELINRISKDTKVLFSVPNFDDPYHVRYFNTEEEVRNRYKDTIEILDISKVYLSEVNCLYYIAGIKK